MKLNIVIVEDEINAMEMLQRKVEKLSGEIKVTGTADSVESGLKLLKKVDCNLLLLDIELRDGTGFDLIEKLGEVDFEVIFTTAYNEYAIEAFKVNAVDYLLKPINDENLSNAIERANQRVENNNNVMIDQISQLLNNQPEFGKLALKERGKVTFINKKDIICLKADGVYTKITTKKSKYVSSSNLGHYESILKDSYFKRIHRSFIVNINEIEEYLTSDHTLKMSDGSMVSVSDSDFFNEILG